jgi:hypothetical protein
MSCDSRIAHASRWRRACYRTASLGPALRFAATRSAPPIQENPGKSEPLRVLCQGMDARLHAVPETDHGEAEGEKPLELR